KIARGFRVEADGGGPGFCALYPQSLGREQAKDGHAEDQGVSRHGSSASLGGDRQNSPDPIHRERAGGSAGLRQVSPSKAHGPQAVGLANRGARTFQGRSTVSRFNFPPSERIRTRAWSLSSLSSCWTPLRPLIVSYLSPALPPPRMCSVT